MADHKTDFVIQAALLDKYIHMDNPSEDRVGVSVVIKKIRSNPDLQRYFFGQNPSSGWAQILFEEGFFEAPPNVILVERGYQTPFWPLSAYLASVANEVPGVVRRVVEQVDTDNPVIHEDFVKALIKIPVSDITSFTSRVRLWLRNKYSWHWGLAEATISLIMILAENDAILDAVDLLDELIRPIATEARQYGEQYLGGEAKFRQDLDYLTPSIWDETIPLLQKKAFPQLIRVLEKNLLESIRVELEAQHKDVDYSSWPSFGWRASIADSDQNSNTDYKDKLLVLLRNVLMTRLQTNPDELSALIIEYLQTEKVILRKLGLFILAQNPILFLDLVTQELRNAEFHDDVRFHNDYFVLLAKAFDFLAHPDKDEIIKIIQNGPTPHESEYLKEIASSMGLTLNEYLQRHRDHWIRDRLWVIKSYLPQTMIPRLKALCEKYGTPSHPGFLSWVSEGGIDWISDISPIPKEELAQKSAIDFFEFIKGWKSDAGREFRTEHVSIEGLGKAAADIVLDSPQKYEHFIPRLNEVHPAIAAILFRQTQEKFKKGEKVPWEPLLDLILGCSENTYPQTQNLFNNNLSARINAMHLVLDGLSQRTPEFSQIPDAFLDKVESIILPYLEDSHPDPVEDRPPEGMLGHNDPLTLALNSVRPLAFSCLMELQRRLSELGQDQPIAYIFPEHIRQVLEKKLDKQNDTSRSVHSIFGRYYWLLSRLDINWLNKNIARIFPLDQSEVSRSFFAAAWNSYILYNQPSSTTMKSLYKEYREGIDMISKGNTTNSWLHIPERLFNHIFLEYVWHAYDLTKSDSLLNFFFKLCNSSLRGQAIGTVCRLFKDASISGKQEKWPVIRRFWQWRLNEYSLTEYPAEFKEEIQSFSALPILAPKSETLENLWPLLQHFLPYLADYRVWKNLQEFLASRVDDDPVFVAKYYRLMHEERDPLRTPNYVFYREDADKILITALKNDKCRRDALVTVDLIFRTSGDQKFKKLYEEFT